MAASYFCCRCQHEIPSDNNLYVMNNHLLLLIAQFSKESNTRARISPLHILIVSIAKPISTTFCFVLSPSLAISHRNNE